MEESGRDQVHANDTLATMAVLCEIADHQGIDLYGYDKQPGSQGRGVFRQIQFLGRCPIHGLLQQRWVDQRSLGAETSDGAAAAYMPFGKCSTPLCQDGDPRSLYRRLRRQPEAFR